MISFGQIRKQRRPNLTPMIDVVFLLLVFFMLASRFGLESALPITMPGTNNSPYQGPPRLVELVPGGILLNGAAVSDEGLLAAVSRLTQDPSDPILMRASQGATLQDLVSVMEQLSAAGFTRLVLVE